MQLESGWVDPVTDWLAIMNSIAIKIYTGPNHHVFWYIGLDDEDRKCRLDAMRADESTK